MSHAYPLEAREVLNQIVRDPRFKVLNTAPAIGLQVMAFSLLGYIAFAGSIWSYSQGYIPYLLLLVFSGYGLVMMFASVHEATHGSVARTPWLNDMIGTVAAFLYMPGMSTTVYRQLHLAHHRYTGDTDKDPDAQYVNAPFILCLFRWATKDIHWGIWFARNFSKRTVKEKRAFICGVIVYFAWYGGWLLSPYATEFVLLYLIPQRVFYCVLLYFFAYVQHPPGVLQSEQPFQATVILNAPKWAHPLMIYQDKHIIHHMFPSLPFYRYPKVWAFAKDLMEKQNIPRRDIIEWNWQPNIPKPDYSEAVQTRIMAKVNSVVEIAEGVRSYELIAANGEKLPPFTAGAHIDIHIEPGLVRQYSLCNASSDLTRYIIGVKCEDNGRGGSKRLHELFTKDHVIEISTPRNNFSLNVDAEQYHLVAGGIGITPMLSMAHELERAGKPFTLHLFARSQEFLPFGRQLENFTFADRIQIYFDNEMGLLDRDIPALIGAAEKSKELYICGPQPFMDLFIDQAMASDWDAAAVKFEAFSAVVVNSSNNQAFELTLSRSGKTLQVKADESIVEALEAAGMAVPVSCGQGLCGTCICGVVEGDVDHRDAILSTEEHQANKKIALCVSRAKGESLTIEF